MKKLAIVTFSVLLSSLSYANINLAPPDFDSDHGHAVFVDFEKAEYNLTYDLTNKVTHVKSKIRFESLHPGRPLFDLVPAVKNAKLDGEPVTISNTKSPEGSELMMIDQDVDPGNHVIEIENDITENVSFADGSVSSAFWIKDLSSRKFMELYIPSNFEFDQYEMSMNVTFTGAPTINQDIYTNGALKQKSPNSWQIRFPKYFTASSPYFHTAQKGSLRRLDWKYKSKISGKKIPMTVYSEMTTPTVEFKNYATQVMEELENDYGAWGHPSFVAFGTPSGGGMEHAGAAQTSLRSLDHEMLHSYFAKGVMPANGDSGWIDEAIANWRDRGYQRTPTPGFGGSNLGSQSIYKRNTDNRAYKLGAAFMAYLDFRLQNVGGLKAFLKGYYSSYNHTLVTTEHFKNNLEFFSGINFDKEFDTYILGSNTPETETRAAVDKLFPNL